MGYKIVILAKLVFLIIFNWLDNCLISNKIRDLGHDLLYIVCRSLARSVVNDFYKQE